MVSSKDQMEKVILHFLLFLLNIIFAKSETAEATINFKYESTSNNLIQAVISKSKYARFHDAFFSTKTTSVFLKYQWDYFGQKFYIVNIEYYNNGNQINYLYFNCSNNRTSENIECYRSVRCNAEIPAKMSKVHCVNGFGIYWAHEDEYIRSIHFQNTSVDCMYEKRVACYTLVDNVDFTTADISTTVESSVIVNTDFQFSSLTTTHRYTVQSPNRSLIAMSTYLTQPENSFITSTSLFVEQKSKHSSSVSTSVIAGVTVSIVIVVLTIIIICVLCKRRQRQKESTSSTEVSTVSLESNPNTLSGHLYYNQQVHSSDEHTNSKSTVCRLSNNEHSTANSYPITNSYTNTSDKVHDLLHPIPHSDYTDIEGDQFLTQPDLSLSAHKDTDDYYNTIEDNWDSLVPKPETQDFEDDDCSVNTSYFDVNKVHLVLPEGEYATFNENCSYENISNDFSALHDYNNLIQDNTTIGRNEPAINIRHFEHTYGDSVPKQAGEDNSTLTHDNIYFILETEETSEGNECFN